jgi:hypothetical protein
MLATLKLGAIGALLAALFLWGYHLGGLASKSALEGFEASQAANTAKAVLAERAAGDKELARVNAIVKGYEDAQLSPIDDRIAERVLERACPAVGPVPTAGPHPSGASGPSQEPRSDPEAQRLLQAVFDACEADARELTALQAAWPR